MHTSSSGAISDMLGTPVAIWICVSISLLAALVNIPLMYVPGCNVPAKPCPAELKPLKGEDKEMVEKALRGEWIPADVLEAINSHRFETGQPYLIIHPRSYAEEKDQLPLLRKRAKEDFLFHQTKTKEYLHAINEHDDVPSICDQINAGVQASDPDERDEINREIGKWFTDYLLDSGYAVS